MEEKLITSFYGMMMRSKNHIQADVAYALMMKQLIDSDIELDTLKKITSIYSQYNRV